MHEANILGKLFVEDAFMLTFDTIPAMTQRIWYQAPKAPVLDGYYNAHTEVKQTKSVPILPREDQDSLFLLKLRKWEGIDNAKESDYCQDSLIRLKGKQFQSIIEGLNFYLQFKFAKEN